MWAVLGTMRALMQDVRMRAEAGMIKHQVSALVQDVVRLDDRVAKLKKHFADMQGDVSQIEISTAKITRRGAQIDAAVLSDLPARPAPPEGMPVAPLRAN
jgi:DNA recombination protein RmuC